MDKTWVHLHDPETKPQFVVWCCPGSNMTVNDFDACTDELTPDLYLKAHIEFIFVVLNCCLYVAFLFMFYLQIFINLPFYISYVLFTYLYQYKQEGPKGPRSLT